MDRLWVLLAQGFGAGRIKVIPGTWGTVVALPLAFGLAQFGPLIYMTLTLLLVLGAVMICEYYESITEGHYRSEVVIDEIVGYFVAFAWLPLTWQSLFFAFVLFRFFDILKPFPISYIDREMKGGLGVVADDLAAGIITNIILQFVYTNTNWLGIQL
ncbi:MAG: phosphatidylglycerophosphatase A [Methylococcales bacterium]|nr:phosphatidylglycerophosphatase A [Methylococcales bacterium]